MAYLGEDIKKLGFGLMRLPKNGDEFDFDQVCKMIDRFLEEGFTYFDTAWAYGGSEEIMRKALVERHPRNEYTIATKLAAWHAKSQADAEAQFETSLERSGAGYFDFYLLHNLGENRTKFYDKYDMWNFAIGLKEAGKVKHIGFSFHGTPEELEELMNAHPEFEFVQLQINYADWDNPNIQSRRCYEIVRAHNKSVVIMEPVKGGLLSNPPDSVKDILTAANPDASFASWAIHFSANLDGVMTVLSGMSTIEQMEDNLAHMKNFKHLTPAEEEVIKQAQVAFHKIPFIECTTCNYCAQVCPMHIGISGCFIGMNMLKIYNDRKAAMVKINNQKVLFSNELPNACIKCGKCESVCPQHLHIRDLLQEITDEFQLA